MCRFCEFCDVGDADVEYENVADMIKGNSFLVCLKTNKKVNDNDECELFKLDKKVHYDSGKI